MLCQQSPFWALIRVWPGGSLGPPVSAGPSAALAQGELQRGLYRLDPYKGSESVCGICAQVRGGMAGQGLSRGWAGPRGTRSGLSSSHFSLPALLPPAFCGSGLLPPGSWQPTDSLNQMNPLALCTLLSAAPSLSLQTRAPGHLCSLCPSHPQRSVQPAGPQ